MKETFRWSFEQFGISDGNYHNHVVTYDGGVIGDTVYALPPNITSLPQEMSVYTYGSYYMSETLISCQIFSHSRAFFQNSTSQYHSRVDTQRSGNHGEGKLWKTSGDLITLIPYNCRSRFRSSLTLPWPHSCSTLFCTPILPLHHKSPDAMAHGSHERVMFLHDLIPSSRILVLLVAIPDTR